MTGDSRWRTQCYRRCTTLLCLRMSTTAIYEIAPDLFRLSIYVPDYDMQFNHFLVRDEEPLLFHAGLKGMFPALREAVAKIIDPAKLRHIAWSPFESDEIAARLTTCSLPVRISSPTRMCVAWCWRSRTRLCRPKQLGCGTVRCFHPTD